MSTDADTAIAETLARDDEAIHMAATVLLDRLMTTTQEEANRPALTIKALIHEVRKRQIEELRKALTTTYALGFKEGRESK